MRLDVSRTLGKLSVVCSIAALSVSSAEAISVPRFSPGLDRSGPSSSAFDISALLASPGDASTNAVSSVAAVQEYQEQWVVGPWGLPILSMVPVSSPPPAAALPGPAASDGCGRVVQAAAAETPAPASSPAGPKMVVGPWGLPTFVESSAPAVLSAPAHSAAAFTRAAPAGAAREAALGQARTPTATATAAGGGGQWIVGAWGLPEYVSLPAPPAALPAPEAAPVVDSEPCLTACVGGPAGTLGACDPNAAARSAQIPLPVSLALVGAGLVGVAGLRWARRRS
jgi:hypothetical protein